MFILLLNLLRTIQVGLLKEESHPGLFVTVKYLLSSKVSLNILIYNQLYSAIVNVGL